jgi:hypothetical protein
MFTIPVHAPVTCFCCHCFMYVRMPEEGAAHWRYWACGSCLSDFTDAFYREFKQQLERGAEFKFCESVDEWGIGVMGAHIDAEESGDPRGML